MRQAKIDLESKPEDFSKEAQEMLSRSEQVGKMQKEMDDLKKWEVDRSSKGDIPESL